MCSLEVATWAHEISGQWGSASMQRWAESRHIPCGPSEAQNASENCSVCQQKRQSLQMTIWNISWSEGPELSWQVRLMLVYLKDYKWVPTE